MRDLNEWPCSKGGLKPVARSLGTGVLAASLIAAPLTANAEPLARPKGDVGVMTAHNPAIERSDVGNVDLMMKPEHKRAGQHTLTLDVNSSIERATLKSYSDTPVIGTFTGNNVTCVGADRSPLPLGKFPGPLRGMIGWGQVEWGDSPCLAAIVQVAVTFDASILNDIPGIRIDRAILTYDESPAPICPLVFGGPAGCWLSGEGKAEDKPQGCVDLRVPSIDWRERSFEGLVPHHTMRPTLRRVSAREWDVTDEFRWQRDSTGAPIGADPGYGFLFMGWPGSLDDLTAEDNTVCISSVTNMKLNVTYTVPPDGEPYEGPR